MRRLFKLRNAQKDQLAKAVSAVTASGRCSGCGGCALVSTRITMEQSSDGFQRPSVGVGLDTTDEAVLFRSICPGIKVSAPEVPDGTTDHRIFGRYVSAWVAYSSEPSVRDAGSSGGVLTSLLSDQLHSGSSSRALAVAADVSAPTKSVALTLTTKEDALATAGSRYAPVATLSALASIPSGETALVAKPCEISAMNALLDSQSRPPESRPLLLSFFCAGTPSQHATDRLVRLLGSEPSTVTRLRYRGGGWPGEFKVEDENGTINSMSYNESWGTHLGRDVQWRCKLCVDGTGAHADVSVGDYWKTDERGYPIFDNADGLSVAIARTKRGHELLMEARNRGIIVLAPADLDEVAKVQPLQVDRKLTLFSRQIGRLLAGYPVTRYVGYRLWAAQASSPRNAPRAAARTFVRSIKGAR